MFNSSEECDRRNTVIQVCRPFSEQQKFRELFIQHPLLVMFCILKSETLLASKATPVDWQRIGN
jgi:hypothetical protein